MSDPPPFMKVHAPASTSNLGSGFDVVGLALQMYLEVEGIPGGEGLREGVELFGASRPDNATAPHTASNPATTHVRA